MTDLVNVWVCASRLELIQADRIVSLWLRNPRGDGPVRVKDLAQLRLQRPGAVDTVSLPLMAAVADGTEPREVHLQNCGSAREAVDALNGLAEALAEAAGRSEPALFVSPDRRGWQIAAALPREWIA